MDILFLLVGLIVGALVGWLIARSKQTPNSLLNEEIEKYCKILYSSLDNIEACGGGSARCMMAEIHLPKAER